MSAIMVVAASLLSASPQGTATLVFVPEEQTAEACFAAERAAAVIALTRGVRLVRGPLKEGETLQSARTRVGADVAVAGARKVLGDKREEVSVSLSREGKSPSAKTAISASSARLDALLREVWPSDLPPLAADTLAPAANSGALEAACQKDAAKAYQLSGAAIGASVRALVAPPPEQSKFLASRHARAVALLRAGKAKDAIPLLRAVTTELARGEISPLWRRPGEASSLGLFKGSAIVFEAGAFTAIDVSTGADKWRLEVGVATPELSDAGDGLVLAALEGEIAAIDVESGMIKWRFPIRSPSPEIAVLGNRIYVGGENDVFALDRAKGDVIWRFDPMSDMIAGPRLVGQNLVVAAESTLVLLDPNAGTPIKKTELGDEISAPLTVGSNGSIWAMVGGDQIALVDPLKAEVKLRAQDLPGAEWPPVVAADQLIVSLRKRDKRRLLAYLDPSTKSGVKRTYIGAAPPLVALPTNAGIAHVEEKPPAVVARGNDGAQLWKQAERGHVTQLSTTPDFVVAAAGSHVTVLDPKKGRVLLEVDFGEAVKSALLGANGGAALGESGAVYGFPLPGDARVKRLVRDARFDLARAHLAGAEYPAAHQVAKAMIDDDPEDLDAFALLAAIDEKASPKEAIDRWFQVARLAPRGDPLQGAAQKALAELAGLAPPLSVGASGGVIANDNVFVLATDAGLEGRSFDPPFAVLWKHGPDELGPAMRDHVRAGKTILRAKDGAKTTDLAEPLLLRGGSAFKLKRVPAVEILREGPDGRPVWTQPLESEDTTVADASAEYVLLTDGADPGHVTMLRMKSGEKIWSYTASEKIAKALLLVDRVVVTGAKRMIGLDAESGLLAFDSPAMNPEGLITAPGGFAVLEKTRIRFLDRAKAKPLGTAVLPSPITQTAPSGDSLWVATEDGALSSIDPLKGTIDGRIKLGGIERLLATPVKLLVVTKAGDVIIADATRKLRR